MSLIVAHTGYTYETLLEIPYIYYNDLLEEITLKLQYMSVVNILGRDYADESAFELVNDTNPININQVQERGKKKEVKKERVTITKLKEAGLI